MRRVLVAALVLTMGWHLKGCCYFRALERALGEAIGQVMLELCAQPITVRIGDATQVVPILGWAAQRERVASGPPIDPWTTLLEFGPRAEMRCGPSLRIQVPVLPPLPNRLRPLSKAGRFIRFPFMTKEPAGTTDSPVPAAPRDPP